MTIFEVSFLLMVSKVNLRVAEKISQCYYIVYIHNRSKLPEFRCIFDMKVSTLVFIWCHFRNLLKAFSIDYGYVGACLVCRYVPFVRF